MSHLPEGMSGWRRGRSKGRIAGARSAQFHQPGGVPAKISGRQGINPDRNLSLKNGPIPPCPTLLRPAVAGPRRAGRTGCIFSRKVFQGRQRINPDHKCKFQLLALGRAACPQPASFNIITPKRSARRRRDTPPYLIFNLAKQTQRALRSVGPSCGERDNPVRPLPVIFFGDDSLEVEW